jgi:hypothetical protein
VTRKAVGAFATYLQPESPMNGPLSDGSCGNAYAARIIHRYVESLQMNPTARVLILLALSLLLASTIPVFVTASTF